MPDAAKSLMHITEIKLEAQSLGIEKIDASGRGGYLVFGNKTDVDPLLLVNLVHNEGETYRMQGAHRLQFRSELPDTTARFSFVANLLNRLTSSDEDDKAIAS